MQWRIADVLEGIAARRPDALAQIQEDRRSTWAEFDARATAVAEFLLGRGIGRQDKVAQYMHNRSEYLESVFACFKASLVPVNTNYRYVEDELAYLWDNADVTAVVFEGTFSPRIDGVRKRLPGIKTWLWVDDGSGACPAWATPYEEAATRAPLPLDVQTSGEDLLLLYTGGTTGMPKGVMWDQDTLVRLLTGMTLTPVRDDTTLEGLLDELDAAGRSPVVLPACPLMHGTGLFIVLAQMMTGGCVVTLPTSGFDAVELLDAVQNEKVTVLVIVGDAFGKPIVEELESHPGRWDISSLRLVISSGVAWSDRMKERLLRFGDPKMRLIDALGSSEALGVAVNVSGADASLPAGRFAAAASSVVVTDDGRLAEPGSDTIGRLGVRKLTPVGYYKDAERSAATFPIIDGVRYSLPGDWARLEKDGTITLLGRGSLCINTGGEKVFPEEVEEIVKLHPAVTDAAVLGVPDERFGEAVVALVEARPDAKIVADEITDLAGSMLAPYKVPRRVIAIDSIARGPNGKIDYQRMRSLATDDR